MNDDEFPEMADRHPSQRSQWKSCTSDGRRVMDVRSDACGGLSVSTWVGNSFESYRVDERGQYRGSPCYGGRSLIPADQVSK